MVSFVLINPENYQSRPPLPEDVPLAHTDSSVNLTFFSFALFLVRVVGSSTDDGCVQVHWLVERRRMSKTGRQMSRPSSLQGLESGGPLLLVAVIGEYELVLFRGLVFVFYGISSSLASFSF